jgi:serine/arginine repetitive matrix protein 1
MRETKFPKEYSLKVNFNHNIDWNVMHAWIAKRVTELLGIEEEVLIGFVINLLSEKPVRTSDIRRSSNLRQPNGPLGTGS